MDAEEWIDRPRGVLTKQERRYLLNQLDDEKETAKNQREYRIRKHLRHSLIDFQVLASAYDGLLEPVFEELRSEENILRTDDDDLRHGIEGLFTLLYRALSDFDPDEGLNDLRFHTLLGTGVSKAVSREYARRGVSVSPSEPLFKVHGTEPAVPLQKLKEEYDRGEFLLPNEVEDLYWGGYLSYEEYRNHDSLSDLENPGETVERRYERREELADDDVPTEPEFSETLSNDLIEGAIEDDEE